MRRAGHIHRHPELVANRLILFEANHGMRIKGKMAMTYVDRIRLTSSCMTLKKLVDLWPMECYGDSALCSDTKNSAQI